MASSRWFISNGSLLARFGSTFAGHGMRLGRPKNSSSQEVDSIQRRGASVMGEVTAGRKRGRSIAGGAGGVNPAAGEAKGRTSNTQHPTSNRPLFPLPAVGLFHDVPRAVAAQPRLRLRVAFQVGVPKCGAERKDHAMVIRIARLGLAGQRPVRKGGVLRVIEHQFVFVARRERGVNRLARLRRGIADRGAVFRAGHQHPGNRDPGESGPAVHRSRENWG